MTLIYLQGNIWQQILSFHFILELVTTVPFTLTVRIRFDYKYNCIRFFALRQPAEWNALNSFSDKQQEENNNEQLKLKLKQRKHWIIGLWTIVVWGCSTCTYLNNIISFFFPKSTDNMASITKFVHSNIFKLLACQAIIGEYVCKYFM